MATAVLPRSRRKAGIRWDRVGRVALLVVLFVIVLAYVSPAKRWIQQTGTASHQQAEIDELEKEHERLKQRLSHLKSPAALEREARRLGMIKVGEQAFSVESLERR